MRAPLIGISDDNYPSTDGVAGSPSPVALEVGGSDEFAAAYNRLEAVHGGSQKNSQVENWRMIKRRVCVGLWAVLSVVFFMEVLARVVVSIGRPAQLGTTQYDVKKELSQMLPAGVPTVVFLGTSMTSRAVYSELIDRTLKRDGFNVSVFNLASHAAYPLDELFLLQNAIEHGARPALVVCEIDPRGVGMPEDYNVEFSSMVKGSYGYSSLLQKRDNLLGESKAGFDFIAYLKQQFEQYSYLVRFRAYLKSEFCSIPSMVFNTEALTRRCPVGLIEEEISTRGYGPAYGFITADQIKPRRAPSQKYYSMIRKVDRRNINYPAINIVASYCAERNIPLALLWTPLHSTRLGKILDIMGLTESELRDALQRIARENRAIFIDMHDEPDESNYFDPVHVNVVGSIKVSQRLAETLSSPPFSEILRAAEAPN